MPIDYSKYPSDWKEISLKIRKRAKNKCECRGECGGVHYPRCNAPNGEFVWRPSIGSQWFEDWEFTPDKPNGKTHFVCSNAMTEMFRRLKVVLTVAHLNHTPSDCRDENLKAMCQFCHLNYDLEHHKKNSAETRRKKKLDAGQLELINQ